MKRAYRFCTITFEDFGSLALSDYGISRLYEVLCELIGGDCEIYGDVIYTETEIDDINEYLSRAGNIVLEEGCDDAEIWLPGCGR